MEPFYLSLTPCGIKQEKKNIAPSLVVQFELIFAHIEGLGLPLILFKS